MLARVGGPGAQLMVEVVHIAPEIPICGENGAITHVSDWAYEGGWRRCGQCREIVEFKGLFLAG